MLCDRKNLTNSTAVFKYHINISISVFNPEVQHPRLSFYNLPRWHYRSKCRRGRGSRSWSWVTCWIKCRSWYSFTSIVTEILTFKKGLTSTKSLQITTKNLLHTFSIFPIKFTYTSTPNLKFYFHKIFPNDCRPHYSLSHPCFFLCLSAVSYIAFAFRFLPFVVMMLVKHYFKLCELRIVSLLTLKQWIIIWLTLLFTETILKLPLP